MKIAILAALLILTAAPARAAMEFDELLILRITKCVKLAPAYRTWCRPKHPVYRRGR